MSLKYPDPKTGGGAVPAKYPSTHASLGSGTLELGVEVVDGTALAVQVGAPIAQIVQNQFSGFFAPILPKRAAGRRLRDPLWLLGMVRVCGNSKVED